MCYSNIIATMSTIEMKRELGLVGGSSRPAKFSDPKIGWSSPQSRPDRRPVRSPRCFSKPRPRPAPGILHGRGCYQAREKSRGSHVSRAGAVHYPSRWQGRAMVVPVWSVCVDAVRAQLHHHGFYAEPQYGGHPGLGIFCPAELMEFLDACEDNFGSGDDPFQSGQSLGYVYRSRVKADPDPVGKTLHQVGLGLQRVWDTNEVRWTHCACRKNSSSQNARPARSLALGKITSALSRCGSSASSNARHRPAGRSVKLILRSSGRPSCPRSSDSEPAPVAP